MQYLYWQEYFSIFTGFQYESIYFSLSFPFLSFTILNNSVELQLFHQFTHVKWILTELKYFYKNNVCIKFLAKLGHGSNKLLLFVI